MRRRFKQECNQMNEMTSGYPGDIDIVQQRMVEHPVFTAIRDIAENQHVEAHRVLYRFDDLPFRLALERADALHASSLPGKSASPAVRRSAPPFSEREPLPIRSPG
jgi:hypothetical protein